MLDARNPIRRLLLVLLVAFLSAGSRLTAAEPTQPWEAGPFAAEPAALFQAASRVDAENGDGGVVILFSETRVRFEEDGRQTQIKRMVYRIVNPQAAEGWSTIDTKWFPWHQERPELRARVISADGTVHVLDPATITEAAVAQEPSLFEDGRILRAPLPAAGPGAVVEQETTVRDTAPYFDHGTVDVHPMRWMVPVRHARLLIDAPAGLRLRHVVRQLPEDGIREEVTDGRRRLSFEGRDLAAYGEIEPRQPPDVRWASYVALSTGASWGGVAGRYAEIVEEAVRGAGGAPEIQAFLHSQVPGATRRETIDRLLARLGAEIRYTGIELGAGRIVPRSPTETLKSRFGDCKDKAALLVTLLRALDIPAEVALLAAGEDLWEIEESLPGLGAFNHAIVVVRATADSPEIWIDPTDRYARAGELGAGVAGRLALIASPAARDLVRIPESTAAANRTVETREFFLSSLGPSDRVVETTETWGETERLLRTYHATQDEKSRRELFAGVLKTSYESDQLQAYEHSDPADLTVPFRVRLEVKEAIRGFTDMWNAVVGVFPAVALTDLPEELQAPETGKDGKPKPRQTDYFLAHPFQREVRYRAVPAEGYRAQSPPPGRVRHLGPATFSEEYAVADDGALTAVLRFEIGKRRLTAAEVEALRKGVLEVSNENAVLLQFEQVGEALAMAGRIPEALVEIRGLVARSPQKALPRMHLSRALLAGGMGEAARLEAHRAVELEPSWIPAWQSLAWIREHDEVGRHFGPGFDRAGAIAAYRKAKELDPQDSNTRSALGLFLEYGENGQRYSGDLTPAIEEYRALRTDLDDQSMDENLLTVLMWAGRFGELKELLAEVGESETHATLRLVAIASTEGGEAAIRDAERRLSDGEARQKALLEASQNLVKLRRYEEATALRAEAIRQAPNAAELLGGMDLLRKMRRHEEVSLSLDDPTHLVQRSLLAALKTEPDDARQIKALYSRDILQELGSDAEVLSRFNLDFAAFRRQRKELPADVGRDMFLAIYRPSVTGDGALGYRIALTTPFDSSSVEVFAVREDGEYRLAGSSGAIDSLGQESLRRLRRDDLQGARQWLDWAREKVKNTGGDDPLAGSPFAILWTQGIEATDEEVRCAAASLLAGTEASEQALPLLLSCRDAEPEGPRRTAFDLALAQAHGQLGRFTDVEVVARRLAIAHPRSARAFDLLESALGSLERWDDLNRLAEERLALVPADPFPMLTLHKVAEKQGNLDESEKWLRLAIDSGKAPSNAYNNLAWLALVRSRVDDRAIEHAQRAATLDRYKSSVSLHTLASLYVEQGKTAEAYKIILQALELKDGRNPDPVDWYVFGRLAEHYNLPEAAHRYYARVEREPGESEISSAFSLARKRLAVLGSEEKAANASR